MNNLENRQWSDYQEIPRRPSAPVKLDRILEKRLKAFIKAKKVRRLKTS